MPFTINSCFFSGNNALTSGEYLGAGGGAIFAYINSGLTINNSRFWSNSSSENGGAICALGALSLTNDLFINNQTRQLGGALCMAYGSLYINHCTFSLNSGSTGGALYRYTGPQATVTNSILWNNAGSSTTNREINDRGDGTSVSYSFIDQWIMEDVWDEENEEYVNIPGAFVNFIDSGHNSDEDPVMVINISGFSYELDIFPWSPAIKTASDGSDCGFLP